MGRPVEPVPQDIAEKVIEWLWSGQSLLAFCRQPGMPARRTIYDWVDKDSSFGAQFARASKARGPMLLEMAQEVADDSSEDFIEVKGGSKFDSEHVQRSKLRVDTLLKRAACYNPAECGTKVQVGGDGGEPIKVAMPLDKDAAAKQIASILATASTRKDVEGG